jgi:hypothetical protein
MRHVDGAPFQLTVRSVQSLSGGTHVSGDLASGAVAVGDVLVVRDGARDVGRVWVDAFSYAWPVRPGESAGLRLTRSEPAPSMLLRITPDAETAVVEGNLLVADPVTRINRVPRRVVDAGVLGTVSCRDESTPVRFRDGTYRWINIKRFAIAAGIPDGVLLVALVGNQQYRDEYATPGPAVEPVHGPYNLELITAETFDNIDRVEAVEALQRWVQLCDPVPTDQIEGDLADVIAHIDEADSRYRLPDLGERAKHVFAGYSATSSNSS